MTAPITDPINPVMWPALYQPSDCPMNDASTEPATPSKAVMMKPVTDLPGVITGSLYANANQVTVLGQKAENSSVEKKFITCRR